MGALLLLAVLMALPWASSALASSGVNPPVVTKGVALNVTKTTAELTATVDATGPMPVTECKFEYGISPGSTEASVPCSSLPGTGGGPVPVSAVATNLNPDTSYSFKIVATTEEGTGDGEPESFTTIANAPAATTGKAGEVKLTSALLEGTVNPEGVPATCEFEWGTSHGSLTKIAQCSTPPGSGNSAQPVTAELTGLAPDTPYYFKLLAHGAGGNGEGTEEEFTTPANELTVATGAASGVGKSSATLNGTVNPGGSAVTKCKFDYGTAKGTLTSTAECSASPGAGGTPVDVSANVTGLAANTPYYFKLVAENEAGASPLPAAEVPFTTSRNPPVVTTGGATAVTQTSATLPGTVNPEEEEVTGCAVEYGTTPSLGSSAACASLPPVGKSPAEVSVQVTGLSPGTTYSYRVVAKSAGGEEVGSVATFTTLPATQPPPPPPPPPTGPTTPKGPEPARPPVISSLSESNSVFRVGRSSTAPAGRISRVSPTGTVFSFVLDQPAVVTIAFVREESGHLIGKSCVVGRRGAGKPACVHSYVAMMLGRRARNGLNRLLFTGRVRGRALRPGAYRATFIGESLAGSSTPSTISFRVVAH